MGGEGDRVVPRGWNVLDFLITLWSDRKEVLLLKSELLGAVVSVVVFLTELFLVFHGASDFSFFLTSISRSLQKMTQTSLRRFWHLRPSRRSVTDVSGFYITCTDYIL